MLDSLSFWGYVLFPSFITAKSEILTTSSTSSAPPRPLHGQSGVSAAVLFVFTCWAVSCHQGTCPYRLCNRVLREFRNQTYLFANAGPNSSDDPPPVFYLFCIIYYLHGDMGNASCFGYCVYCGGFLVSSISLICFRRRQLWISCDGPGMTSFTCELIAWQS